MNRVNILGVNIDKLNKKQVDEKIQSFLNDNKQHFIVTPNPEIILAANYHDEEFFYILSQADLAIPDGIGLKFAGWLMGKKLTRLAGADLLKEILNQALKNDLKVAVISWNRGLSSSTDIKEMLNQQYHGLKFIVLKAERQNKKLSSDLISEIINSCPQILFVNLGAPYQEKLIYHNLKDLPSVRLAMPVGGSFDYLTGKTPRAPKFMQILGLEWLWRLIYQPWRWQRIYKAVFVFTYKFFLWRFIYPFLYRPNVVCLLYKKVGDKYQILIAERRDWAGHWQLPQGGTDGEDLMQAGVRELSEEIGTNKFKPVASFKNLWKYIINPEMHNHDPALAKKSGYKGQRQGLFIAEFYGQDSDITINFWDHQNWQWVDSEKLVESVHPIRQPATKIFYEKFKQVINQNNN